MFYTFWIGLIDCLNIIAAAPDVTQTNLFLILKQKLLKENNHVFKFLILKLKVAETSTLNEQNISIASSSMKRGQMNDCRVCKLH